MQTHALIIFVKHMTKVHVEFGRLQPHHGASETQDEKYFDAFNDGTHTTVNISSYPAVPLHICSKCVRFYPQTMCILFGRRRMMWLWGKFDMPLARVHLTMIGENAQERGA